MDQPCPQLFPERPFPERPFPERPFPERLFPERVSRQALLAIAPALSNATLSRVVEALTTFLQAPNPKDAINADSTDTGATDTGATDTGATDAAALIQQLEQTQFIFRFDWPQWLMQAAVLDHDRDRLAQADLLSLRQLMTVYVRTHQFYADPRRGALQTKRESGQLEGLRQRLMQLSQTLPR